MRCTSRWASSARRTTTGSSRRASGCGATASGSEPDGGAARGYGPTTMTVPLLSVSGSWFRLPSYSPSGYSMPVTVKVTVETDFEIDDFEVVHSPVDVVRQVTVPVAPLLQNPLTVAPLT